MIVQLCLFLICFNLAHAFIEPSAFDSGYFEVEDEVISKIELNTVKNAKNYLDDSALTSILDDRFHKVDDEFHTPDYFKHNVHFWFKIYTKYTFYQVVIHDKVNMQLIYKVMDYQNVLDSDLNHFSKDKLKRKLTYEYIKDVRQSLKNLSKKDYTKLNQKEVDLLEAIKKAKLTVPKKKKEKVDFFNTLAKNIRSQSGQRDLIFQGIINSLEYIHFMENTAKIFGLPKEVLSIPFLESSFNLSAQSKVNAVGIWQFMDYTNNLVMPRITKTIDYRLNPIVSTIAAMHLLKENRFNLKTWDLAISAYNAGTKHLMRARRKYKNIKNVDLAYIIEHYKHPSLGFAAKNFYSEFLALSYTLAYRNTVFPLSGMQQKMKTKPLHIYVSLCSIVPNKFFKALKSSEYNLSEINAHFLKPNQSYNRGSLVVSDVDLTTNKYYKLSDNQLVQKTPKKYERLVKNKKCRN